MPRQPRTSTDTTLEQIGQESEIMIPASGAIDRSAFTPEIETVDTPLQSAHAQELLFMEEKVLVEIPVGADPEKEEQFIPIHNNGIVQYLERGKPLWIRRKFVEVLARAKREKVTTPEIIDSTGARTHTIKRTPALIHQFQVHEDKNPNGRAWLQRILAEA